MYPLPFSHQAQCSLGQSATDDLTGLDRDDGLLSAVHRVKVRRRVIGEVHPDDDPLEATDRRHTDEPATGAGRWIGHYEKSPRARRSSAGLCGTTRGPVGRGLEPIEPP